MRKLLGIMVAVALVAAGCSDDDGGGGDDAGSTDALQVEVVSSQPEYVTGGDALVAVTADDGVLDGVTVTVDGEDVTDAFAEESGRLVGLVEGLADGDNAVEARRGDDRGEATLVNHSDQGPVFSGEPLELVSCTTDTFGLEASTPADGCFAPTKVTWEYVDAAGERHPLADPEAAPADVQTVEVAGESMPFVIRIETGVLNRSVFRIDKLEGAWNERLVYRFGGGCGTTFSQGFMGTGPASQELLQLGYATATATFNTYQVLCNDVISAETASMVKEHFTEAYGEPAFTIGEGGSGGAIQQILLAQNYPGLLDAIAPSVPFPDAFSISPGVFDCALLGDYYASPEGGQLSDEQRQAVNGHATTGSCDLWARTFAQGIDPAAGCRLDLAAAFVGAGDAAGPGPGGIPAEVIYDADTNPDGLRCTVWETNVALVGRDPDTGFANSGYDNRGVQYGLDALNAGVITPAQFLDLNERVGGFDIDGQPQPERSAVDPDMMALAFTTGRVSGPWGGLPDTPIILINVFTDEMGDIHDRVRSFSLLDRLSGDDGETPATVSLWTLEAGSGGLVETLTGAIGDRATQPTLALDTWLTDATAYQDDHPDAEWREALAEAKPEAAESRCFVDEEEHVVAPDDEVCAEAFPISEEPRMAAGGPRSGDVLKCQLVPVDEAEDQYEVDLSAADLDRLAEIFPDGVCDWTQRSVGYQEPDGTWQSFNDE
ncbi:MAG TPA: DUF6351 family protein [Acidimicrobiales bacterium]|nr:DUF6351 family protein [Acidimicrobiales bacterium]